MVYRDCFDFVPDIPQSINTNNCPLNNETYNNITLNIAPVSFPPYVYYYGNESLYRVCGPLFGIIKALAIQLNAK